MNSYYEITFCRGVVLITCALERGNGVISSGNVNFADA